MSRIVSPVTPVAQRIDLNICQLWAKRDPGAVAGYPPHNGLCRVVENTKRHLLTPLEVSGATYAGTGVVDVDHLTFNLS